MLSGPWLLRALVRVPRSHLLASDGPVTAARWLGEIHRRWLLSLGLEGSALYGGALVEHWACFRGRAPGEVMVGGRKITGIAQAWRRADALLAAGTLLTDPPWRLLCDAVDRSPAEVAALAGDVTSLRQCLGRFADTHECERSLQQMLERGLELLSRKTGSL